MLKQLKKKILPQKNHPEIDKVNKQKIIGVVGDTFEGTLLYLPQIYSSLDYKVAVIDISKEQDLIYYMPEYQSNIFTYHHVDYYFHMTIDLSQEVISKGYDLIIINCGYSNQLLNVSDFCNHIFICTSLMRKNLLNLRSIIRSLNEKIVINRIFIDVVDCKINEVYINQMLDNNNIIYKNDHIIFLDTDDYRLRIESQYDIEFKFNKLSKEYREFLGVFNTFYIKADEKNFKKALKRTMKGKSQ